ncbi:ABC transporter ATP-binding protein [Thermaerobacter sp. PB12/4term]|uniref:EscU/YscU/HrcU family type III secretion system export apparatus switch protein n=1 Tax=Thermaerobacter sp. PB12/4term TaxID=2293838 RepID=UPI000E325ED6|nr:EscU/YscU/HrcU family type III secretion system export apparatus switch protein [Thermaerobacter sp. PB12/4term]QIA27885.1 ABC transporter ATP-binding protein [Thermaerobacter sp. PB12/4term]
MSETPEPPRPDGAEPPPQRAAAALRFDPSTDPAPRVVAAGFGTMAEAILRRAREAGVPEVTSPLAPVLARVPPGQTIPAALFEVVAQIMALALELDRQMAAGRAGRAQGPDLAARWGLAAGAGSPAGAGSSGGAGAAAGSRSGPVRGGGGSWDAPPGGPAPRGHPDPDDGRSQA